MTTVAMSDNKIVMHGNFVLVGGDHSCCYDLCNCKFYGAFWNTLNLLLDPSAGQGIGRDESGCARGYADAIVTDPGNNNCPGGAGKCAFEARIWFTGTWTLRTDKPDSPCWVISDVVIDEVVATNVDCNCPDEIQNATIFEQNGC